MARKFGLINRRTNCGSKGGKTIIMANEDQGEAGEVYARGGWRSSGRGISFFKGELLFSSVELVKLIHGP